MLRVEEVAERMGVHRASVNRWATRGLLHSEKRGKARFYAEEEIDRFWEEEGAVREWSQKYDCCQKCGTTDGPHCARGMCWPCYHKWWRENGKEAEGM